MSIKRGEVSSLIKCCNEPLTLDELIGRSGAGSVCTCCHPLLREMIGEKVWSDVGEDWRTKNIDKGPLPALFLRETAALLEKSPIPLSLFLGSDFPISSANKFKGRQAVFLIACTKQVKANFFMIVMLSAIQPCLLIKWLLKPVQVVITSIPKHQEKIGR